MQTLAQWITNAGPLAPVWLVIPIAILTLLVVAGHVVALEKADMPASRRRIRTVNGLLMMFTIPLAAYAFGIASPARQRLFVMVWVLVIGLVLIVLFLAVVDLLNTWLITLSERREMARQIAEARAAGALMHESQSSADSAPTSP
jgi:hypothetical protein